MFRCCGGFNEAAGADPADATVSKGVSAETTSTSMRPRGQTPRMPSRWRAPYSPSYPHFNEAAGADPADAVPHAPSMTPVAMDFNEAAGADPADADDRLVMVSHRADTSMRPRGQTPRMRSCGSRGRPNAWSLQ